MAFTLSSPPPEDSEAKLLWLVEQIQRLEDYINDPDIVKTQVLYVAPTKPREGMIVIADGTKWNPGAGAGTYVYRAAAWRKMD